MKPTKTNFSSLTKTNPRQFEVEILGPRRPAIGEVFEIEVGPYRARIEVECVDRSGPVALVEKTDGGGAASPGAKSRVISDRKVAPPDVGRSEADQNWEEHQASLQPPEDDMNWDDLLDPGNKEPEYTDDYIDDGDW